MVIFYVEIGAYMKKKGLITFLVIADTLIVAALISYFLVRIQLIGDAELYINLNDSYFENGYKAKFFAKELKDVEIKSNVNTDKLGDYEVKYTLTFGPVKKSVTRKVHVVDKEGPEITLNGNEHIFLDLNAEYVEEGYAAEDNIDGDLTEQVKVTSNVDASKGGDYEIVYSVTDSAGNKTEKKRSVEVLDNKLLLSPIEEFWLKDTYDDVTLKYEDIEYDYFKDTIFLGDSNTLFLHSAGGYIAASQAWGKYNLNIAQINSSFFTTLVNNKADVTLKEAVETYKPKYLVVSVGINAPLYMNKIDLVNEIQKFIDFMKGYPDTTIAFTSILPVTVSGSLNPILQKTINEYNYYLLEICHKNKVKYINFSDEVRAASGYADEKYFGCNGENDCGFHLNAAGKEKYIDYIKHLNLEKEI